MAKKMHIVELVVAPRQDNWPSDYFPRKFYYLRDAKELVAAVAERGGKAVVKREQ